MAGLNAVSGTVRVNSSVGSPTDFKYKVQLSNDGGTWTDLTAVLQALGVTVGNNYSINSGTDIIGSALARVVFELTAGTSLVFTFDLNTYGR